MKTFNYLTLFLNMFVIISLYLLQAIFLPIAPFLFALSFTYIYIFLFIKPKILFFVTFVIFAFFLDAINYLTLGSGIFILSFYYIVLLLKIYFIKNPKFLLSYAVFMVVNVFLMLINSAFNFIAKINTYTSISFLIAVMFCYPIIYIILTSIYRPHAQ